MHATAVPWLMPHSAIFQELMHRIRCTATELAFFENNQAWGFGSPAHKWLQHRHDCSYRFHQDNACARDVSAQLSNMYSNLNADIKLTMHIHAVNHTCVGALGVVSGICTLYTLL